MIHNFSWVIPDRLAGAALPGEDVSWNYEAGPDQGLLSDLRKLRTIGIRRLVSLTDFARGFGPLCREAGLEWTYFPIPDFAVPESLTQFGDLIDSVTGDVAAEHPVCVHCFAGIGRTGLVLSCVVGRYYSLEASQAIRRVRDVRQALETPEQELFVQRFLEALDAS